MFEEEEKATRFKDGGRSRWDRGMKSKADPLGPSRCCVLPAEVPEREGDCRIGDGTDGRHDCWASGVLEFWIREVLAVGVARGGFC